MPGEHGPGLDVVLDLEEERLLIRSTTQVLGEWPISDVGIRGRDDGFHLMIEGEEIIVSCEDEAGFALAVGLHTATPALRRRISAGLKRPNVPLPGDS
jgi:hypothetical protein